MSKQNKQQLKEQFKAGSNITQAKLENLIDSSVNKVDDLSITDGNIGIGTSSPEIQLDIRQQHKDKGLRISKADNTQEISLYLADNESGEYGYLHLGGNTRLRGNGVNSSFDGNVGIGTTSPTQNLHVTGNESGNVGITVQNKGSGNPQLRFLDANNNERAAITFNKLWQNGDKGGIVIKDGDSNILNIREGNVGIGTTSPSQKLEVAGNTSLDGTLAVTGATTLNSDLTVTGNFNVNGTTTTINSQNHVVDDSLMGFGNVTTGTPINDSRMIIERGISDNVFIGWDESIDKFTL